MGLEDVPPGFFEQNLDEATRARVDLIKEPKPKTWVGKALVGGEWALGGLSDIASRNLWLPLAKAVTPDDPLAQYRLEQLEEDKAHPIFAGDVASAAGLFKGEKDDPGFVKVGKGISRFVLSVAGDPLTYIPIGNLTKLGRATQLAKAAAAEGRTIEEGSKVGKLVAEVFGDDFLKADPAKVQKIIQEAELRLTKIPEPTLRRMGTERALAEKSIKAKQVAWFNWEGKSKKIFVGSKEHKALSKSLGFDPLVEGRVHLKWSTASVPGSTLAIPFHLAPEAQAELRALLERYDLLMKADISGSSEAVSSEISSILKNVRDKHGDEIAEALNNKLPKTEVAAILKKQATELEALRQDAKSRLVGTHSLEEGTGSDVKAALNAYNARKLELLKQTPLTTRNVVARLEEEVKKIVPALVKAGREDLIPGFSYKATNIIKLRSADIPEVNQILDTVRSLSQLMKRTRLKKELIEKSSELFIKTKWHPPIFNPNAPEVKEEIGKLVTEKIKALPTASGKTLAQQIKAGERTLFSVSLPGGIEFAIPVIGKGALAEGIANAFTAVNRIGLVNRIDKSFRRVFSTATGNPEFDKMLSTFKSLALHRAGLEITASVDAKKMIKDLAKQLNTTPEKLEALVGQVVERETRGVPIRNIHKLVGPLAEMVQVGSPKAKKAQEALQKALAPITGDLTEPTATGRVVPRAEITPIVEGPKPPNHLEDLADELGKDAKGNWGADLDIFDTETVRQLNPNEESHRALLLKLKDVLAERLTELNSYITGFPKKYLTEDELRQYYAGDIKSISGYGRTKPPLRLRELFEDTQTGTLKNLQYEKALYEDLLSATSTKLDEWTKLNPGVKTRPFAGSAKAGEHLPEIQTVLDNVRKIQEEATKVNTGSYIPSPVSKVIEEFRERKARIEMLVKSSGVPAIPAATDREFLWNSLTLEAREEIEAYLVKTGKLKVGFRPSHFRKEALKLLKDEFTIIDVDKVDDLMHAGTITKQVAAGLKGKRGLEKLDELRDNGLISDKNYSDIVYTLGPADVNDFAAQKKFPWQKETLATETHTRPGGTVPDLQERDHVMNQLISLQKAGEYSGPEYARLSLRAKELEGLTKEIPERQFVTKAQFPGSDVGNAVFHIDPIFSSGLRGVRSQQAITATEFFNELVARGIGVKADQAPKGYLAVPQELLDGYLFPPEVARALSKFQEFQYNDKVISDFLKLHDNVQDAWKAWTLAIFPAYHTRNFVGNLWNNWLAGIAEPKWYIYAGRLQGKQEFSFVDGLGKKWGNEELIKKMKELGVLDKGWVGADISRTLSQRLREGNWDKIGRGNKVVEWGFKFGQGIENNARMAHFMGKLGEGMTPEDAALSVKRYLFDYGDLTDFERKVMKRLFPFYTWTRKNIPLQLQHLVTQPAKFSIPYKARRAIEDDSQAPDEKYLPQWVIENYPTRIRYNEKSKQYEYFLAHSWLPSMDLVKLLELHETATNMLTPVPKELLQQLFNYDYFLKRKIQTIPGQKDRINLGPLHVDLPVRVTHGAKLVRLLTEIDKLSKPDLDFWNRISELATSKTYIYDEQKAKRSNRFEVKERIQDLKAGLRREARRPHRNEKEMERIRNLIRETAQEY